MNDDEINNNEPLGEAVDDDITVGKLVTVSLFDTISGVVSKLESDKTTPDRA